MSQTRNFNNEAIFWDEKPSRVTLAKEIASAILATAQPHRGTRVLDFGCGTGLVSLPWAAQVAQLTGIDTAAGMLEVFCHKAEKLGLNNVSCALLAPDSPPQIDGCFDLIVSSMALHHVPQIAPLLDSLYAALAAGGQLCLADLDPDDGQFHEDNHGVFHQGFDRAELCAALAKAGFKQLAASTATSIDRPGADGKARSFTIFLISARK